MASEHVEGSSEGQKEQASSLAGTARDLAAQSKLGRLGAILLVLAVVAAAASWLMPLGGRLAAAKKSFAANDLDGSAAPDFRLQERGGSVVHLANLRGKAVLVVFWASWCPPCREEEPSLDRLARSFDPSTFEVIAINVDDGPANVEKFLAGRAPGYRVAFDSGGISDLWGTNKLPESYLVDQHGALRLKFIGPRDWSDEAARTILIANGARLR